MRKGEISIAGLSSFLALVESALESAGESSSVDPLACGSTAGDIWHPWNHGYRRVALEEAIEGQQLVLPARRLPADGLEAWVEVERRGYEGMVGKDEASAYRPGRSLAWLKVKTATARDVVAGRFRR